MCGERSALRLALLLDRWRRSTHASALARIRRLCGDASPPLPAPVGDRWIFLRLVGDKDEAVDAEGEEKQVAEANQLCGHSGANAVLADAARNPNLFSHANPPRTHERYRALGLPVNAPI